MVVVYTIGPRHESFVGGTLYLDERKKMTWLPTWRHFYEGDFFRGQVSWANLKALDKKLGLRKTLT